MLQRAHHLVATHAGRGDDARVDGGPVGGASGAAFVADPAHVGAGVGEHHGPGLQSAHGTPGARPVVHLLPAVRAFGIGAVEPDFVNLAVLGEQFGELRDVEVVVARRVAVGGLVSVPRREIQSGADAIGPAGVDELPHQVARTSAPWAGGHRVRGGACWPEAEAVVMLGGEDHGLHTGGSGGAGPLPGIEGGGIEDARVLGTVAPLTVGEGVHPEVHEERELVALPVELGARGTRARGGSGAGGVQGPWAEERRGSGRDQELAAIHS